MSPQFSQTVRHLGVITDAPMHGAYRSTSPTGRGPVSYINCLKGGNPYCSLPKNLGTQRLAQRMDVITIYTLLSKKVNSKQCQNYCAMPPKKNEAESNT